MSRSAHEPESIVAELPQVLIFHREAESYAAELRARVANLDLLATSDEAEFRRALPRADVVLAFQFPLDALPTATRLRWIQITSAGTEFLEPMHDRLGHLVVTNARGLHAAPIADYVMAALPMLFSDFPAYFRNQQARTWQRRAVVPLEGKTLGIVGLGAIGQEIARRAGRSGMNVLGVRHSGAPAPHVAEVYRPDALQAFLPRCDVVVLVVPDTSRTRAMIGAAELAAMKRSAFLINVGRGSAIDEPALVEALTGNVIAGACLDVFAVEPLPPTSPLWTLPNVIVTPHIAGMRDDYAARLADIMADNLGRFVRREPLRNLVDLSRWVA